MTPTQRLVLGGSKISLTNLFGGADGFYYDFTVGATGAGIASITSQPPPTTVASQGTGSKQPVWTIDAPSYALFDGVSQYLSTTLLPGPNMTMAFFAKLSGGSLAVVTGAKSSSGDRCFVGIQNSHATIGWGGSAAVEGTTNISGSNVVVVARASASKVEIYVNGKPTPEYSGTASGTATTAYTLSIGALNNGGTIGTYANMPCYRLFTAKRYLPNNLLRPLALMLGRGM
jgi:hypothetical protein